MKKNSQKFYRLRQFKKKKSSVQEIKSEVRMKIVEINTQEIKNVVIDIIREKSIKKMQKSFLIPSFPKEFMNCRKGCEKNRRELMI